TSIIPLKEEFHGFLGLVFSFCLGSGTRFLDLPEILSSLDLLPQVWNYPARSASVLVPQVSLLIILSF
ncbi:MAG TPA: hypothetical protein PLV78_11510, partial [Deltaproteobacteria bacterium]|nr:hypothetical protein [Deltaproteobacteria bacterium]